MGFSICETTLVHLHHKLLLTFATEDLVGSSIGLFDDFPISSWTVAGISS